MEQMSVSFGSFCFVSRSVDANVNCIAWILEYYLTTSLEDVAIAIVIVARRAWFRQHVRNIVGR